MKKIEHIGIAVSDIEAAKEIFDEICNKSSYKSETVESEGVNTTFYQLGETKIELLEAANPESPIAKFISKKGQGMHHIAFDVVDIKAEMGRLKKAGFILLNDVPKKGADNKWVCFLHPKFTCGVLIELCQEII